MMKGPSPLLQRATLLMLFAVLATVILYYGKPLLLPLSAAALFSMLLLPLVRRLERWKLGRFFSVLLAIVLFIAVAAGVISMLSAQVVLFIRDMPTLQQELNERLSQIHGWINRLTGLTPHEQIQFVRQGAERFLGLAQNVAMSVLSMTTNALVFIGLQFILIFLLLYYRSHIRAFILLLLPEQHHQHAQHVIQDISLITQRYVGGVFIVVLILSVLNTLLFSVAGVPHALLFGLIAAFLNIIPYLGIWIGTGLPMLTVAVLDDSFKPLIVIVAGVWIIQQLENHVLTPRITGAQVALNPMATILALLAGSLLWGVAGMILFLPLLGIAKIVFDAVDELKPFGFLIGEQRKAEPSRIRGTWLTWRTRIKRKKTEPVTRE
ncbi:MAG: AI-2E family transporter [Chitinophagales bacterium]|nr:AI-2E family transporter [Chitinophagales bacterium]MDW8394244.1 AI-2E family transporter [Chitinophagales bacterium]